MPVIEVISQDESKTKLKILATMFGKGNNPYDLTGEYFVEDTDFGDKHGLKEKFAIYDHGLNELQNELAAYAPPDPILGVMKFLEKNDRGRWFELEIERANEYHDFVMELHRLGRLGASSRTVPGSKMKSVEADGRITRWPEVEISLTPTPAEARTAYSPEDFEWVKGVLKSHLLPHLEKKSTDIADAQPVETTLEDTVQKILDSVPEDAPATDIPEIQPDPLVEKVTVLEAQVAQQSAVIAAQAEAMVEMQKSVAALLLRLDSTEKSVVKTTEFVAQRMIELKKSAAMDSDQFRETVLGLPAKDKDYTPPPPPRGGLQLKSAFGPHAPGSN